MVEIRGKQIIMTRGDTAVIRVSIQNPDGTEYEPENGDRIRFAMKKNYTDATPILNKEIPLDTMELVILPEETKNLKSGPILGRYKYDIELTRADGTVDTFIPRADFLILEEVL